MASADVLNRRSRGKLGRNSYPLVQVISPDATSSSQLAGILAAGFWLSVLRTTSDINQCNLATFFMTYKYYEMASHSISFNVYPLYLRRKNIPFVDKRVSERKNLRKKCRITQPSRALQP